VSGRFQRLPGFRAIILVIASVTALLPLPTVLAPDVTPGTRIIGYGPVLAGCLWAAFRVSGCGLRDAGDHLVIRNPLRTVRIPWRDVASVELGRFGVMPKVGVRRTDGSAVGIFGLPIAASGKDADASTLRLMEEMRAKAQQVRSGQDQGSGHVRG
jgi:hypothetical protein